ncbi:MAG: hypothetical protein HOC24_13385 [Deltaproteobacteria bacterium]|jgi:hypothetical protein|nr:hypothetical protein [Deltaproteobacteria bacterium]
MNLIKDDMRFNGIFYSFFNQNHIRKLLFIQVMILWSFLDVNAQIDWLQDNNFQLQAIPVLAELKAQKNKNEFEIIVYGRLKPGQYIYSTYTSGKDSPIPSRLYLIQPKAEKIEVVSESETISIFDEMFHKELKVHKNDFLISQKFKLVNPKTMHIVKGIFKYQVCTSKICSLPLQSPFLIEK